MSPAKPRTTLLVLAMSFSACRSDTPALRATCDAGNPDACAVVGARLLLGTEGTPDEPQSATFFKREIDLRTTACASGDATQCAKLTARGMPVNVAPLDLPKSAAMSDAPTTFKVDLTTEGGLRANGEPLADDAALLAAARRTAASLPGVRATIQADAAVHHGRVVRALDLLKQAGITKIAFSVTPVPLDGGSKP